jgi:hypothetical protein
MRAVEATGTIDREGHLLLDQPFGEDISSRVRVIVLFSEPVQELEDDPDDTPIEIKIYCKSNIAYSLMELKFWELVSYPKVQNP